MLTGLACVRKPGTRRLTSSCGRSFCRRLGSACFAAGPCHRPDFPTRSILQTHGRLEATSAGPGRAQHSAKRGILLYVEPSSSCCKPSLPRINHASHAVKQQALAAAWALSTFYRDAWVVLATTLDTFYHTFAGSTGSADTSADSAYGS